MRDLALPLSILVLAGVMTLDHLPTAHAEDTPEGPGGPLCNVVKIKAGAFKAEEAMQAALLPHLQQGEVTIVPMTTGGFTGGFMVCSWPESD